MGVRGGEVEGGGAGSRGPVSRRRSCCKSKFERVQVGAASSSSSVCGKFALMSSTESGLEAASFFFSCCFILFRQQIKKKSPDLRRAKQSRVGHQIQLVYFFEIAIQLKE